MSSRISPGNRSGVNQFFLLLIRNALVTTLFNTILAFLILIQRDILSLRMVEGPIAGEEHIATMDEFAKALVK